MGRSTSPPRIGRCWRGPRPATASTRVRSEGKGGDWKTRHPLRMGGGVGRPDTPFPPNVFITFPSNPGQHWSDRPPTSAAGSAPLDPESFQTPVLGCLGGGGFGLKQKINKSSNSRLLLRTRSRLSGRNKSKKSE